MKYPHYAIQAFFDSYPEADVCFETYDGITHPTKEIASKWVELHANKSVKEHARVKETPKKEKAPGAAANSNGKGQSAGKPGGKSGGKGKDQPNGETGSDTSGAGPGNDPAADQEKEGGSPAPGAPGETGTPDANQTVQEGAEKTATPAV